MKLLTLTLASKFNHVINFDDNDTCPRTYIVENHSAVVELLRMNLCGTNNMPDKLRYTFQTDAGAEDVHMKVFEIRNLGTNGNISNIEIDMEFYSKDSGEQARIDSSWQKAFINWNCVKGQVYDFKLNVKLHYLDKTQKVEQSLEHCVKIDIVPSDQLYDVVLDYGSDATQMLAFRRDVPMVTLDDRVLLLDMFKSMLNEQEKSDEYVQNVREDAYLFRAHYFVKRSVTTPSLAKPYDDPVNNTNVKLLTPFSSLDEIVKSYVTMNNVKISAHGGLDPRIHVNNVSKAISRVGNNYFYRATINPFIHAAIRNVVADPVDTEARYISIFVLMPNVYDQEQASKHIRQLEEDAAEMLKLPEYANIKAIAFHSVSESDAAFLGYCAACAAYPADFQTITPGKYLIMDAGKGTLDFSILEYLAKPEQNSTIQYRNLYRSGIVGSGNAISYAFMQSLLRELYSKYFSGQMLKNKMSDFIRENVIGADQSELHMLVELLETYKKNYNSGLLEEKDSWTGGLQDQNDELSLNAFNNWLRRNLTTALTDDSIVKDMIGKIVSLTIEKLPSATQLPVDRVIFSGRGFLMNMLHAEMKKQLDEKYGTGLQELKVNTERYSMKNICMFISNYIYNGHYDGHLLGVPQIEFPGNAFRPTKKQASRSVADILSSIESFFKNVQTGGVIDHSVSEAESERKKRDFFVNGKSLHVGNTASQCIINGVVYTFEGTLQGNVDLFFDGEKFVFRSTKSKKSNITQLSPLANPANTLVFESMFPYGILPQNNVVPMPVTVPAAPVSKPNPAAAGTAAASTPAPTPQTGAGNDTKLIDNLNKRKLL